MKSRIQLMKQGIEQVIGLPAKEEELQVLCNNLRIANTSDTTVTIMGVDGEYKLDQLLANKEVNLDELNYLLKRMDSFDTSELDTFYAAAYAKKAETMVELINLTFQIHCYSIVRVFSNLNTIGMEMYLREQGGVNTAEFEHFDGEAYFRKIIEENQSPVVTPYGILYQNSNQPEQVYNGRTFPAYWYESNPVTLSLSTEKEVEYLYLPVQQSEIEKALSRLLVKALDEVTIQVESHNLPQNIADIALADTSALAKMNQFALSVEEMKKAEIHNLAKVVEFTNITTVEELNVLTNCIYEFETFPDVHSPMEYGAYLICESGRFDYDDNLAEYIDFERYGKEKIQQEGGTFTPKGYLLYHGYHMEMQNILHQKVGMQRRELQEQMQLKLYMPLSASTYYEENVYGELQRVDFEHEVYPSELKEYEEEISMAMQKRQRNDGKRGMMEYYDQLDCVNAKVASYVFSVEEVQGKLMGVAILTLNEALDRQELAKIKEEISGQASDGFGEGMEQCEICCGGKEIYVSIWGRVGWSLNTAEELGIIGQAKGMSMTMQS